MKKKPRILAIRPKKTAVFNYRMTRPLTALDAKFRKSLLRKNESIQIKDLAKRFKKLGDIWVIKYIDHRHTLDILYTMRDLVGAKVVLDIDDNVWQIPLGNRSRGTAKQFSNRAIMTMESVKAADWVTVSTKPLKDILTPLNTDIAVLPNYIIPEEWNWVRHEHKKVRIGWVYSQTHMPDIKVVRRALEDIYEKYKDKVEIVVFGVEHNIFKFPTTNIPPVRFGEYPRLFTEEGIDISIAPLQNNEFNKCKSNIKWLESAMAGAAFIGSNVYPYKTSVKNGVTGYLASNRQKWVKYMSELIESKERREELAANAKKEVLKDYTSDKKWKDFYNYLAK